jgi:hypothetical protein
MARLLPPEQARKPEALDDKATIAGKALAKLQEDGRLDVTNAARYLQISPQTLRPPVVSGRIPSIQIGATLYLEARDLENLRVLLGIFGTLSAALKGLESMREHQDTITHMLNDNPNQEEY